jgi:hypothetical protein
VDEEFKVLLEYVEHQFIGKIVMGLKVTWKEIRPQKFDEYVKKKCKIGKPTQLLKWNKLLRDGILCTTFSTISHFYKVFCHHSHGHTTKRK